MKVASPGKLPVPTGVSNEGAGTLELEVEGGDNDCQLWSQDQLQTVISSYCGLKVCVPPKFINRNPNLQGDGRS